MDKMQLIGLSLFTAGIIILIGSALYGLMEALDMPPAIKIAIFAIIIGITVILISLVRERLEAGKQKR